MYWPWSRRLARRADDSLSLRPRRSEGAGSRAAASSAGTSRASARPIDPSDRRIAWTSLPTAGRLGLGKCASMVNGPANRTTDGDDHRPPSGAANRSLGSALVLSDEL